jgi:hypothetical protein
VAGQGVGRLVGDDRGQVAVALDVFEQAGVDAHLAPGQTEGIGVLIIIEDHKFPLKFRAVRGLGDALPHLLHPGLQGLVLGGAGFPLDLLEGLEAQGQFLLLGDHEHLLAAGVRGGGAPRQDRPDNRQHQKKTDLPFT